MKKLFLIFIPIIIFAFLFETGNRVVYAGCRQVCGNETYCEGCWTGQEAYNCRGEYQGNNCPSDDPKSGCKYVEKCDYRGGTWHQCCNTYATRYACHQECTPDPTAPPPPSATPRPTVTPIPPTATPIPPTVTPIPPTPDTCPKKSKGDANCDGKIDGVDYSIWLNNQCKPSVNQVCNKLTPDFDGDKDVDDDDYTIWFGNRGS